MCTAVTYHTKDDYFGRNLDYERSFGESIVIVPRRFSFSFQKGAAYHYAIIGIAHVAEGEPLFYDAVNEKGLAMAGLLFAGNAVYHPPAEGKENVPSWAFLSWVLQQCATVEEAAFLLQRLNLTESAFRESLPPSPLHWMITDGKRSLVVESVAEGLRVYENPIGVLTNNPPFPFHRENLRQYLNLTAEEAENRFSKAIDLAPFSRGMGAMGLPGDVSSASRFVRAAFTKLNARCGDGEAESVSQFFHILGSVEQVRGCVHLGEGKYEMTLYSSCCNLQRGIYYYTTYEDRSIRSVGLRERELEGETLYQFPMETKA